MSKLISILFAITIMTGCGYGMYLIGIPNLMVDKEDIYTLKWFAYSFLGTIFIMVPFIWSSNTRKKK